MSEEVIKELEKKDDFKSPINGSPLVPKGDGLFYSEYDEMFYTMNKNGTVTPLKSPINGSPLVPKDGLFYSEHDEMFYTMNESGTVTPLKSPINGSPLVPKEDGLFYSEHDELFYALDETGKIIQINENKEKNLETVGDNIKNIENAADSMRVQIGEINEETRNIREGIIQDKNLLKDANVNTQEEREERN